MKQPRSARNAQKVLSVVLAMCLVFQMLPVGTIAYAAGERGFSDGQSVSPDEDEGAPAEGQQVADESAEVETNAADDPADQAEVTTLHRAISFDVKDADGSVKTTVEVEGDLPSDATLVVTEFDEKTAQALAGEGNEAYFSYDVTILSEGAKWHLADSEATLTVRVHGASELPEGAKVLHYLADLTDDEGMLDDHTAAEKMAALADDESVETETVDIALTDNGAYEFQLKGLSPFVAFAPEAESESQEAELSTQAEPTRTVSTDGLGGSGDVDGLHYEWSAKWVPDFGDGANAEGDEANLLCHPTEYSGANSPTAKLHLRVSISKIEGQTVRTIPAGAVKISLPLSVFYGWDLDADYIGDSHIVFDGDEALGPVDILTGYEGCTPDGQEELVYQIDEANQRLILTNREDVNASKSLTSNLTLTYTADALKINGGHPSEENVDASASTNWWENYEDFYQKDLTTSFSVDDTDINESGSLHIEVRTRAASSGRAFAMPTSTNGVFFSWKDEWGARPDDASENFYIVWNLSYGRGVPNHLMYATQGFESTITAPEDLNTVTVDGETFQGKLISIDRMWLGAWGSYPYYASHFGTKPSDTPPTYGSSYVGGTYIGQSGGSLNGIAALDGDGNRKMEDTLRNVCYQGYGGENNAHSVIEYHDLSQSISSTSTGSNYAIVMAYPKALLDKIGLEVLSNEGFEMSAKFQVTENWDSDYSLQKVIEASPTTVAKKGGSGGYGLGKMVVGNYQTVYGGQDALLAGNDLWLRQASINQNPYVGNTSHVWYSTYTGTSWAEDGNNLGQHIVLTDTKDSTLHASSGGSFAWNPPDLVKLDGDDIDPNTGTGDYSYTGFMVKLDEYEGIYYEDDGTWEILSNSSTDYVSYEPVYVYIRKAGENNEFEPYAVVMRTASGYTYNAWNGTYDADGKPILGEAIAAQYGQYVLPENVVQVQLVHDSGTHTASDGTQKEFRKCVIQFYADMQIHPTERVVNMVRTHVNNNKQTWIRDITGYETTILGESALSPDTYKRTGDNAKGSTLYDNVYLNTAGKGLSVVKHSKTPATQSDSLQLEAKEHGYQISYVMLLAYSTYGKERRLMTSGEADNYRLLSGTFYELLPKGTTLHVDEEHPVKVFLDTNHTATTLGGNNSTDFKASQFNYYKPTSGQTDRYYGYLVPQESITVTQTEDLATGQTLVKIDYEIDPAVFDGLTISSNTWHNMVQCHFIVDNTEENITTYGQQTENAVAYVQNIERDPDQLYHTVGTQATLDNAQLGERAAAFNNEKLNLIDGNTISRFAKATIAWNAVTYSETVLTKKVLTPETNEGITARNEQGLATSSAWADHGTVTVGNPYKYRLQWRLDEDDVSKGIVFIDVLESGYQIGDDAQDGNWQGTLVDVDTSVIASKTNDADDTATCDPVVYYSTSLNKKVMVYEDYGVSYDENGATFDPNTWSTTPPADLADVTAIAVDCWHDTEGNEFVLGKNQSLPVILSMIAPDKLLENETTGNGLIVRREYFDSGSSVGTIEDQMVSAKVTMRDVNVIVAKASNPKTGTPEAPTQVAADGTGTIDYRLTVTNDNPYDVKDVVVSDAIPAGLTVTSVEVRLNGADSATPADATEGFSSEEANGTYTFTIDNQWPGEKNATEIVIHCAVDSLIPESGEPATMVSDYQNTAYLIEANGRSFVDSEHPNGEPTDTTYHRAELTRLDVTKVWDDEGMNSDRPESVTAHVAYELSDGAHVDDVTVAHDAATDSWPAVTLYYPRYEVDASSASYDSPTTWNETSFTVTEDPVDHYVTTVDGTTITNARAKVEETLEVTKDFADWDKAGSFEFTLAAVTEGAPMPASTTATATKNEPTASFGIITFLNPGTYEYTITETNGGVDGVSYDVEPHKVTVVVSEADDHSLSATVTYADGNPLTITNTFTPTTAPVEVTKQFNDWTKAESFEFTLAAVTEGAPMPASATATATKDEPVASFGNITFEKAGTYEYTITEENGGADGVSYDVTPHTLTVTVTKADDASNALTATVAYDGGKGPLIIENTFTPIEATLQVTKAMEFWGRAKSFEFTLAPVTEGAPMPDSANLTVTKDEPVAAFPAITFEKAGTYEYTITEVDGGEGGVVYDTEPHRVTVTVTKADDATNALAVTVSYEEDEGLTVTNGYRADGSFELGATKVLTGRELKAGEFSFELVRVADASGTALAGATPEVAVNAVDGTVLFGAAQLSEVDFEGVTPATDGTRTIELFYAVREVIPDGAKSDGSRWSLADDGGTMYYDGATHIVTVTATDNGDGTITCAVDKPAVSVCFENEYVEEPPTPEPPTTSTPNKPTTPAKPTVLPKTGDVNTVGVTLMAGIGAAFALFGLTTRRRRHSDD